jgi:hypothetical protein
MVNFISIEPVVGGVRGQSELETGLQSGRTGLEMWTADTLESATRSKGHDGPAPGVIEREAGREILGFYIILEPFRNGARPIVEVLFQSDRPREVGFRLHSAPGGKPMDSCVLSATMGNYGRLRRLWLQDEVIAAETLWQRPVFDKLGFLPWKSWGHVRLLQTGGQVLVAATSDEIDPAATRYDPSVPPHWRYAGKPATHYWRGPDNPGVVVRVNGRTHYWGNGGPIPGGVAYENFELEAPFQAGQEFWFGVTEQKPEALGFESHWGKPTKKQ